MPLSPSPNRAPNTLRIIWSAGADDRFARMRREGVSLRALAKAFGLSRSTIAQRAARLGLELPARPVVATAQQPRRVACDPGTDLSRDPLPPGHPISWGLITAGTCLEGAIYTPPSGSSFRTYSGKEPV